MSVCEQVEMIEIEKREEEKGLSNKCGWGEVGNIGTRCGM
jgi:hypothetical protein